VHFAQGRRSAEDVGIMLWAVVSTATSWLNEVNRAWLRPRGRPSRVAPLPPANGPAYLPLDGIRMTDGVGHTLFDGYATHRAEARGDEETGWVLLGLREQSQAVVLATLPAGAQCDASVSHVRFNSMAQAVGSRIVRQAERRLTILGVVHTHPGSLRHPSDGDYAGDSQWVRHLRGGEGIFAIGTADARNGDGPSSPSNRGRTCRRWGSCGCRGIRYGPGRRRIGRCRCH